jgi:hypothetical protein
MARRQQQLPGPQVLADGPDVLPGRRGRSQRDRAVRAPHQVLVHDDRVATVRQRVAGVDLVEPPGRENDRGGGGVRGPHSDAVHRCAGEGGC